MHHQPISMDPRFSQFGSLDKQVGTKRLPTTPAGKNLHLIRTSGDANITDEDGQLEASNSFNAALASGRTIHPDFIENQQQLPPSKPVLKSSSKLTLSAIGRRHLPYVLSKRESIPAHIQIEVYDRNIARNPLTHERAKFYLVKKHGDYDSAYGNGRFAQHLPQNLKNHLLPKEQMTCVKKQYEFEVSEWLQKYDFRRRETGEKPSEEELNRDIEEWMASRPTRSVQALTSTDEPDEEAFDDLVQSLSHLVLKKYEQGPDAKSLLSKKELDDDLDSYMSKRKEEKSPEKTATVDSSSSTSSTSGSTVTRRFQPNTTTAQGPASTNCFINRSPIIPNESSRDSTKTEDSLSNLMNNVDEVEIRAPEIDPDDLFADEDFDFDL